MPWALDRPESGIPGRPDVLPSCRAAVTLSSSCDASNPSMPEHGKEPGVSTDTRSEDARVPGHPEIDETTTEFDRDLVLRCLADLG